MAIDTTVGGASANSWASVAEFKVYRAVRMPQNAVVLAAVDAIIEAALIAACREINADFAWTGQAVDSVQALTWPRQGMLTRNGYVIPTTVNPQELKDAQCELAYQMMIAGADLITDSQAALLGIASVKAGSVAVGFQSVDTSTDEAYDLIIRRLGSEFNYISNAIPGEVRRLLVPSWFEQPSILRPIIFGAM